MLHLYAQTFMIATRTEPPQRPDVKPAPGPRPAPWPGRELPHLRSVRDCTGRHPL